MAAYGQGRWEGDYDIFAAGPRDGEVAGLGPEAQRDWVSALRDAVFPVGGWAVIGAEQTVMRALSHPVDLLAYRDILDAALELQRQAGVWASQLSPNEQSYWRDHHPAEVWLPPRDSPGRDAATITPLAVGAERRVAVMSRVPDSNEVYVVREADGVYKSIVDMPVERGTNRGRVRQEADVSGDLYELYWIIGNAVPLPNYWTDPELEPFCPFPPPLV